MSLLQLLSQGDTVTRAVAALLLAMSVASWVVILWKAWMLRRAGSDLTRSTAAFWQSASLTEARQRVQAFDRETLVLPLIDAASGQPAGPLAAAGDKAQQLTRVLRDALHRVLDRLQFGQVLLATVGSTAPFVGLLGTVWGIYHALTGLGTSGQITIDKVSGPVGEALIMTAAGLAVAIPAVAAFNYFQRRIRTTLSNAEALEHILLSYLQGGGPLAQGSSGRSSSPDSSRAVRLSLSSLSRTNTAAASLES